MVARDWPDSDPSAERLAAAVAVLKAAPAASNLLSGGRAAGAAKRRRDPYRAGYIEGRLIEPPLPPERLLALAEENAVHGPCIVAKAYDAVGRGWTLEPEDNGAVGQGVTVASAAEETARLAARLEALTPDLSFTELLFQAAYEREAVGWAAWEVVRGADGQIGALYPLPAHTLRACSDPDVWCQRVLGSGDSRYFAVFGTERVIDPDTGRDAPTLDAEARASEILLFRGYSARSRHYGVPLWINAAPAIAELSAIREYNVSWFASGGMTDKLLHVSAADPATAATISAAIREQFQQAKGIGHTTVFTAGTPDVSVGVTFLAPGAGGQAGRREGQFIDRRDALIKEILMAHSVPPYRIGWAEMGALGGNAAREMLRSYAQNAVLPLQTMMADRLNQTLFGPQGFNLTGFRWRFVPLAWDETEFNLEMAVRAVEAGILSPNEGRRLLGMETVDEPAMGRHYRQGTPVGESGGEVALRAAQGAEPARPDALEVLTEFRDALQAVVGSEDGSGLEIEKFNPYHDSRGRFTTGQGAASVTLRPYSDGQKERIATSTGAGGLVPDVDMPLPQPTMVSRVSVPDTDVHERIRNMFGRDLTDGEIAGLTGAPDGALVSIHPLEGNRLAMKAEHPHVVQMIRIVERTSDGLVLHNESFFADAGAPDGFGTRALATQVATAQRLGVRRMETNAARGKGMNGYYTWPCLGYDTAIPLTSLKRGAVKSLPPSLSNATRLHEVMTSADGRAWWKQWGVGLHMEFDLTPGSAAALRLAAYLREKGITKASSGGPYAHARDTAIILTDADEALLDRIAERIPWQ